MIIFTCDDRFEDMMTCVYTAYEYVLKEHAKNPDFNHNNVKLMRAPVYQPSMFDEYIHVDSEVFNMNTEDDISIRDKKYNKVIRSIKKSISYQAFANIYYASLSREEDALDTIYRYIVIGFQVGEKLTKMLTNPIVERIFELRRRVGNEAHFSREFARFNKVAGENGDTLYVCHMSPKDNVIAIMARHFADRMPSEYWMIIDDTRKMAVVHPAEIAEEKGFLSGDPYYDFDESGEIDEDRMFIRYLTDKEFEVLKKTEDVNDEFTDMWKTFFNTIAIKERYNYKCQRNLFPLWMRKHAVEFE